MTKPLTIITHKLPISNTDPIFKTLSSLSDLYFTKKPLEKEPKLKKAAAILTFVTDKVDESLLKKAPQLKVISNFAVGFNNIDLNAAAKRYIHVTNTPDVLTNATAEMTIALIFAAARRMKEGVDIIQKKSFKGWEPSLLLGKELKNSILGIVGMGRIGSAVATKARALGMHVIGCNQLSWKKENLFTARMGLTTFERVLSQSDFVSIHTALNEQTKHLLNAKTLRLMKAGSFLINTSRGEVINERALIQALGTKKKPGLLLGAALDVFEHEPKLNEALRKHPRVIVLPHVASATKEARTGMAHLSMQSIIDTLQGRIPRNKVN